MLSSVSKAPDCVLGDASSLSVEEVAPSGGGHTSPVAPVKKEEGVKQEPVEPADEPTDTSTQSGASDPSPDPEAHHTWPVTGSS